MRRWLQSAVSASNLLASQEAQPETAEVVAQCITAVIDPSANPLETRPRVTRFPRSSHVAACVKLRPWATRYWSSSIRERLAVVQVRGPQVHDAESLRRLLADGDSQIRAMAAEALATIHLPQDVPLIARLLDDAAPAAPFLGENIQWWPVLAPVEMDPLDFDHSWWKQTASQSAKRALLLMTGQRFNDQAHFARWWKLNSDGPNSLWYWQQRLDRELDTALELRPSQRPDETWDRYASRWRALRVAALAEAHKTIAAELGQLSPEVEAKVRLLAVWRRAGGSPITGAESESWPDPPSLRLTPDRLLDLLDRKDMWADVPWDDKSLGMYNLLAQRLGMWAHVLFRPADVPRLRAVLERERKNLLSSGRAGMTLGIARLLPAADADNLDDPDTRDGALRLAVLRDDDWSVRGISAKELVRVGLALNGDFLKAAAFVAPNDENVMTSVLDALAKQPLTPRKREFLFDLVLDPRFEPLWTLQETRSSPPYRQYGIRAVNAHAGREVISNSLENRLTDSAESAKAMAELRRLIESLRETPTKEPPTPAQQTRN